MKTTLKISFLIVLTIIQSEILYGQGNIPIGSNQIKLSPLRIVDPVNPGIEVSFEKLYAKRYSSQIAYGFMKDFFNVTGFYDYKGWRLSFEEKYFTSLKNEKKKYYSFEFVYLNVNYYDASSYIQDTALMTPEYLDSFKVMKQTFSFNIKYGIQIPLNHFIVDISAGIGIKYKMVERVGVDDMNAYEVKPKDQNVYYIASKEGNYFGLNVPVNIKIGYHF